MGFRFRKSINFGGGFRINLSKSGVGYSWGMKGMRWTKMANGRNRSTYSIPNTGLAYITESSGDGGSGGNKQEHQEVIQDNKLEYSANTSIDTSSAVYDDFMSELIRVRKKHTIATAILIVSFLLTFVNPLFIIVTLGTCIYRLVFRKLFMVKLDYNFDDTYRDYYEGLTVFFDKLASNCKVWLINAQYRQDDTKYHSGATSTLVRTPIVIRKTKSAFIDTDVEYYCLFIPKKKFYFLPDRILVEEAGKVYSMRYSELHCNFDNTDFIEEEGVAKDSEVLRTTWKYVNKNGSPDKRFSNNYEIPICNYGVIQAQSTNGFDITLHTSNGNSIVEMKSIYDDIVVKRLNFTFEL